MYPYTLGGLQCARQRFYFKKLIPNLFFCKLQTQYPSTLNKSIRDIKIQNIYRNQVENTLTFSIYQFHNFPCRFFTWNNYCAPHLWHWSVSDLNIRNIFLFYGLSKNDQVLEVSFESRSFLVQSLSRPWLKKCI